MAATPSHQGKTALVTGAAGGLGKVIAETFLAAGANVVICDVNEARLSATSAEWKAHEGKFLAERADVTDEASVEKLVSAAVAKFGRLDVLVNNAGIMDDFSPAGGCSKEQWDRVLGVNLTGVFLVTKYAVNHMLEKGGGVIINIGSNASIYGFQAGLAYTVSKAGVMALTKNTAGAYGNRGVSCAALLLGGMADTNIAEGMRSGVPFDFATFQAIEKARPQFDPSQMSLPLTSVAKYCVFLTGADVAPFANGSCVVFNKNWPFA